MGFELSSNHLDWVKQHDLALEKHLSSPTSPIEINGQDLTIADIIAVSLYNKPVTITKDPQILEKVTQSVEFLKQHLQEGNIVYGINTGYGGSADTRSDQFTALQQALIQHHSSGILLPSGIASGVSSPLSCASSSLALPRPLVRDALLIRCNSLLRGHSAVRLSIITTITTLLNHDFIPIIPLRGSIFASGDLTPLSYLAGALEGNPGIYVSSASRRILPAEEALKLLSLEAITMKPKEALHETQYLALTSQTLTATCTEALGGSKGNYHPFTSDVRPHTGQSEAASNIHRVLETSKLVAGKDGQTAGLYQDRYALRTAPQWIGPTLEDLLLAIRQVSVELNSTTDNPLIEVDGWGGTPLKGRVNGKIHHGGNFQAASLTSACEKTRLAVQMLGRLLFAQCAEMINPLLNNTLTPNLCFDEPSTSFTMKGVDVNIAGYMSELGFLGNTVGGFVQNAEMGNQDVNSLALISGRVTMESLEVLGCMVAAGVVVVEEAGTDGREGWFPLFEKSWVEGKSLDTLPRAEKAAEATIT
ncbi:Phenylalanine/histidine ammonia-lyase [Piedraia hortae CBS 480.64]|uniref:Phenylalanine/histidine ammonia-lyase n=1 Tax=Piedraia hortae CBS 480.64 TaxID=1314780 RepID=A0A6A7C059_9PEZI|nr:Phenylalanine/histidine ammonia-lyase [Piedraia hortae CBS 480.64]